MTDSNELYFDLIKTENENYLMDENGNFIFDTTPAENCMLFYDFSDPNLYSNSHIVDLNGHSNGNMVNGPTYETGSCGNNFLYFDGNNDYVITNNDLNPYLSPNSSSKIISLFTWVYPMGDGVIISEQGSNSPDNGWHDSQIEIVSETVLFGVWPYDHGSPKIISSIPTPLNQWYYIGLTYDGSILRGYVNGQLAGSATYIRSVPSDLDYELHYALGYGTLTNMLTGNFANMRMGTFEVYNNVMSDSQILFNYNNAYIFWSCSLPPAPATGKFKQLKRAGHYKVNNRGDRFIKNTKRLFKNLLYRLPGSAYNDND